MKLKTIDQFCDDNPCFSKGQLRWIRHKSTAKFDPWPYGPAFIKVGGRLLIDEERFFEIIQQIQISSEKCKYE